MKKIGIQYSNDNGVTWSTALELYCEAVSVYKLTETEHDRAANKRKNERATTYMNADVLFLAEPFDPARTAAAEANWLYVQNFCAAKLRRIYNADTTNWPTLDEHDTFNSNSNTNYVNLLEMKPSKPVSMDENGANTTKIRQMQLYLQTRDKI